MRSFWDLFQEDPPDLDGDGLPDYTGYDVQTPDLDFALPEIDTGYSFDTTTTGADTFAPDPDFQRPLDSLMQGPVWGDPAPPPDPWNISFGPTIGAAAKPEQWDVSLGSSFGVPVALPFVTDDLGAPGAFVYAARDYAAITAQEKPSGEMESVWDSFWKAGEDAKHQELTARALAEARGETTVHNRNFDPTAPGFTNPEAQGIMQRSVELEDEVGFQTFEASMAALGTVRRNIMRVPGLGDTLRVVGDALSGVGIGLGAVDDLVVTTPLPTGYSLGEYTRAAVDTATQIGAEIGPQSGFDLMGPQEEPESPWLAVELFKRYGDTLQGMAEARDPLNYMTQAEYDAAGAEKKQDLALAQRQIYGTSAFWNFFTGGVENFPTGEEDYREFMEFTLNRESMLAGIEQEADYYWALGHRRTSADREGITPQEYVRMAEQLQQQANDLRAMSPKEFQDSNLSIANQLLAGTVFDWSSGVGLITGGLFGSPITRRVSEAEGRFLIDPMTALDRMDAEMGAAVQRNFGPMTPTAWQRANPFAIAPSTKVWQGQNYFRELSSTLTQLTTDPDEMRRLLEIAADDPRQLITGIDAAQFPGMADHATTSTWQALAGYEAGDVAQAQQRYARALSGGATPDQALKAMENYDFTVPWEKVALEPDAAQNAAAYYDEFSLFNLSDPQTLAAFGGDLQQAEQYQNQLLAQIATGTPLTRATSQLNGIDWTKVQFNPDSVGAMTRVRDNGGMFTVAAIQDEMVRGAIQSGQLNLFDFGDVRLGAGLVAGGDNAQFATALAYLQRAELDGMQSLQPRVNPATGQQLPLSAERFSNEFANLMGEPLRMLYGVQEKTSPSGTLANAITAFFAPNADALNSTLRTVGNVLVENSSSTDELETNLRLLQSDPVAFFAAHDALGPFQKQAQHVASMIENQGSTLLGQTLLDLQQQGDEFSPNQFLRSFNAASSSTVDQYVGSFSNPLTSAWERLGRGINNLQNYGAMEEEMLLRSGTGQASPLQSAPVMGPLTRQQASEWIVYGEGSLDLPGPVNSAPPFANFDVLPPALDMSDVPNLPPLDVANLTPPPANWSEASRPANMSVLEWEAAQATLDPSAAPLMPWPDINTLDNGRRVWDDAGSGLTADLNASHWLGDAPVLGDDVAQATPYVPPPDPLWYRANESKFPIDMAEYRNRDVLVPVFRQEALSDEYAALIERYGADPNFSAERIYQQNLEFWKSARERGVDEPLYWPNRRTYENYLLHMEQLIEDERGLIDEALPDLKRDTWGWVGPGDEDYLLFRGVSRDEQWRIDSESGDLILPGFNQYMEGANYTGVSFSLSPEASRGFATSGIMYGGEDETAGAALLFSIDPRVLPQDQPQVLKRGLSEYELFAIGDEYRIPAGAWGVSQVAEQTLAADRPLDRGALYALLNQPEDYIKSGAYDELDQYRRAQSAGKEIMMDISSLWVAEQQGYLGNLLDTMMPEADAKYGRAVREQFYVDFAAQKQAFGYDQIDVRATNTMVGGPVFGDLPNWDIAPAQFQGAMSEGSPAQLQGLMSEGSPALYQGAMSEFIPGDWDAGEMPSFDEISLVSPQTMGPMGRDFALDMLEGSAANMPSNMMDDPWHLGDMWPGLNDGLIDPADADDLFRMPTPISASGNAVDSTGTFDPVRRTFTQTAGNLANIPYQALSLLPQALDFWTQTVPRNFRRAVSETWLFGRPGWAIKNATSAQWLSYLDDVQNFRSADNIAGMATERYGNVLPRERLVESFEGFSQSGAMAGNLRDNSFFRDLIDKPVAWVFDQLDNIGVWDRRSMLQSQGADQLLELDRLRQDMDQFLSKYNLPQDFQTQIIDQMSDTALNGSRADFLGELEKIMAGNAQMFTAGERREIRAGFNEFGPQTPEFEGVPNPIAAYFEFVRDMALGNTNIGGRVGFGEAANFTRVTEVGTDMARSQGAEYLKGILAENLDYLNIPDTLRAELLDQVGAAGYASTRTTVMGTVEEFMAAHAGELSVEQRMGLREFTTSSLLPAMDDVSAFGASAGESVANFVMLDTNKARNYQQWIQPLAMFSYFRTETFANMVERMVYDPSIFVAMMRYDRLESKADERDQLPDFQKGTIGIPGLDVRISNPLDFFSLYDTVKPSPYGDVSEATNWWEFAQEAMETVGLSFSPDWHLSLTGNGSESSSKALAPRTLVPQLGIVHDMLQTYGFDGLGNMFEHPLANYLTGQELATQASIGAITEEQALWGQDLIHQRMYGTEARNDQPEDTGDIWRDARGNVAWDRALPALFSTFLGFRVYNDTDDTDELRRLAKQYANIPKGQQDAWLEAHPGVQALWANNGLYPQDAGSLTPERPANSLYGDHLPPMPYLTEEEASERYPNVPTALGVPLPRMGFGGYLRDDPAEMQARIVTGGGGPRQPDDLEWIKHIGPKTEAALYDAGFTTYEDIYAATVEELSAVEGISASTAANLQRQVGNRLQAVDEPFAGTVNPSALEIPEIWNRGSDFTTYGQEADVERASKHAVRATDTTIRDVPLPPTGILAEMAWEDLQELRGGTATQAVQDINWARYEMGLPPIAYEGLNAYYALVDPRDERVFYIGQTNNPDRRFTEHLEFIFDGRQDHPKAEWGRDMLRDGVYPEMHVLGWVPHEEIDNTEMLWVGYFLYMEGREDLTNVDIPNLDEWKELMAWSGRTPAEMRTEINQLLRGEINRIWDPEIFPRFDQDFTAEGPLTFASTVDDLADLPKIGDKSAATLRNAGLMSFADVATASDLALVGAGVSKNNVDEIRTAARDLWGVTGFEAAVYEWQNSAKPDGSASGPSTRDDLTGLPGIGEKTQAKLYAAGIDTIAELAASDIETLKALGMSGSAAEEAVAAAKELVTVDPFSGAIMRWQTGQLNIGIDADEESGTGSGTGKRVDAAGRDDFEWIAGVGPTMEQNLYAAGIDTLEELAHADPALLDQIYGIGPSRATILQEAARQRLGQGADPSSFDEIMELINQLNEEQLAALSDLVGNTKFDTSISTNFREIDTRFNSKPDDFQWIKGVGEAYQKRLYQAGVDTLEELAYADPAKLLEISGFGETRVTEMQRAAKARLGVVDNTPTTTGNYTMFLPLVMNGGIIPEVDETATRYSSPSGDSYNEYGQLLDESGQIVRGDDGRPVTVNLDQLRQWNPGLPDPLSVQVEKRREERPDEIEQEPLEYWSGDGLVSYNEWGQRLDSLGHVALGEDGEPVTVDLKLLKRWNPDLPDPTTLHSGGKNVGAAGTDDFEWMSDAGALTEYRLHAYGIDTLAELATADVAQIAAIEGVGAERAYSMQNQARWRLGMPQMYIPADVLEMMEDASGGGTRRNRGHAQENLGPEGSDDFEWLSGVGPIMERDLYAAGITTLQMLIDAPVETLDAIQGLGPAKIEELQNAARVQMHLYGGPPPDQYIYGEGEFGAVQGPVQGPNAKLWGGSPWGEAATGMQGPQPLVLDDFTLNPAARTINDASSLFSAAMGPQTQPDSFWGLDRWGAGRQLGPQGRPDSFWGLDRWGSDDTTTADVDDVEMGPQPKDGATFWGLADISIFGAPDVEMGPQPKDGATFWGLDNAATADPPDVEMGPQPKSDSFWGFDNLQRGVSGVEMGPQPQGGATFWGMDNLQRSAPLLPQMGPQERPQTQPGPQLQPGPQTKPGQMIGPMLPPVLPPPIGGPNMGPDQPAIVTGQDHSHAEHDEQENSFAQIQVPDSLADNEIAGLMANVWNEHGDLIEEISESSGIDPEVAAAVLAVESGGSGFGASGDLKVRFETHLFWSYWGKENPEEFNEHFSYNPDVTWQDHLYRDDPNEEMASYHDNQKTEWEALNFAMSLDEEAAIKATSMGASQVLGANFRTLGYESPKEMMEDFAGSEDAQIQGMFSYIMNSGAGPALKRGDLEGFASSYNGPGRASYYAGLIAERSEMLKRIMGEQGVTAADGAVDEQKKLELLMPFLLDIPIIQGFGANPQNYERFGLHGHDGLDWMLPTGTDIYASAAGVVDATNYEKAGYGNYVRVAHDWGYSYYAHLDAFDVEVGDEVNTDTILGQSGNTGNSSGPHLHFTIKWADADTDDGFNGKSDPLEYLRARPRTPEGEITPAPRRQENPDAALFDFVLSDSVQSAHAITADELLEMALKYAPDVTLASAQAYLDAQPAPQQLSAVMPVEDNEALTDYAQKLLDTYPFSDEAKQYMYQPGRFVQSTVGAGAFALPGELHLEKLTEDEVSLHEIAHVWLFRFPDRDLQTGFLNAVARLASDKQVPEAMRVMAQSFVYGLDEDRGGVPHGPTVVPTRGYMMDESYRVGAGASGRWNVQEMYAGFAEIVAYNDEILPDYLKHYYRGLFDFGDGKEGPLSRPGDPLYEGNYPTAVAPKLNDLEPEEFANLQRAGFKVPPQGTNGYDLYLQEGASTIVSEARFYEGRYFRSKYLTDPTGTLTPEVDMATVDADADAGGDGTLNDEQMAELEKHFKDQGIDTWDELMAITDEDVQEIGRKLFPDANEEDFDAFYNMAGDGWPIDEAELLEEQKQGARMNNPAGRLPVAASPVPPPTTGFPTSFAPRHRNTTVPGVPVMGTSPWGSVRVGNWGEGAQPLPPVKPEISTVREDLEFLPNIGAKMEGFLYANGINNAAQLAQMDPVTLDEMSTYFGLDTATETINAAKAAAGNIQQTSRNYGAPAITPNVAIKPGLAAQMQVTVDKIGLPDALVIALQVSGYDTVWDLATANPQKLAEVKGMSLSTALGAIIYAQGKILGKETEAEIWAKEQIQMAEAAAKPKVYWSRDGKVSYNEWGQRLDSLGHIAYSDGKVETVPLGDLRGYKGAGRAPVANSLFGDK